MHQIQNIINRLVYNDNYELLHNDYKRSQDYFILQAVFVTAFGVLTGGTVMSGFFIHIGASDIITGFIGVLANVAGIFSIFSSLVLERFAKRKKLIITVSLATKWMVCSIVLIPLFVPKYLQAPLALIILFMAYVLQTLNNVGLNVWFISVIPENIRGRYFGIRQMVALVVSITLPIAVGIFLDKSTDKYAAFSLLYSVGALIVLFEVFAYTKIEEPEVPNLGKGALKIGDIFRVPIQNKKFIYYVLQVCLVYMALYISCSFSSVYMIRYLKLSYTFLNMNAMFGAAIQMVSFRIWGRISDKYGPAFVLRTSIWFYLVDYTLFCLAPASIVVYTIPFGCMFSAAAASGLSVGAFNYRYALMPETGRSLFEGFYAASIGVAFLLSPVIGGILKGWLQNTPAVTQTIQFGQFRILYGISVIGVIMLQVIDIMIRKRENARQAKEEKNAYV